MRKWKTSLLTVGETSCGDWRGENGVLFLELLREASPYTASCSDSLKSSHTLDRLPSCAFSPPLTLLRLSTSSLLSGNTSMEGCRAITLPWECTLRLLAPAAWSPYEVEDPSPFLSESRLSAVEWLRFTPPCTLRGIGICGGVGEFRCFEQSPHFCDSFQQSSTPHSLLHCFPLNFFFIPSGVMIISPFLAPL